MSIRWFCLCSFLCLYLMIDAYVQLLGGFGVVFVVNKWCWSMCLQMTRAQWFFFFFHSRQGNELMLSQFWRQYCNFPGLTDQSRHFVSVWSISTISILYSVKGKLKIGVLSPVNETVVCWMNSVPFSGSFLVLFCNFALSSNMSYTGFPLCVIIVYKGNC